MKKETINEILGIKESIEMPFKVKEILFTPNRDEYFNRFLKVENDLSYDWFNEYFQQEQADRRELKQDYTPESISRLVAGIAKDGLMICDICSGSGSLTIAMWNKNKDAIFQCEEVSDRVFPLLLFNMSIRNMEGIVLKKDILTGDVEERYELVPGDRYSKIRKINFEPKQKFDVTVMNPPYSLKCDRVKGLEEWGALPTNFADWIFVLYGWSKTKPEGQLLAILPHGVLFRGQKEERIRKKVIDKNMVRTIIGLPDKLFMNTSIPVMIMELQKAEDTYIIDASDIFEKHGRQNEITEKQNDEIIRIYEIRKSIEKISKIVTKKEIEENSYNLNIPRYISKFEEKNTPPIGQIVKELVQTEAEIRKTERELLEMMEQMTGTNGESDKELKEAIELFRKIGG